MQFEGLIGIFDVCSCSCSQLQFAHPVDLFQNMLIGKHLERQLLEYFFFSLDDNQNKTNEKKEKKMVSQKPHGTIEYTVSIGFFSFVHVCFLEVGLLRSRGSQWHKTENTKCFHKAAVCTCLNRDHSRNHCVWGEQGSHPELLFHPGPLLLLTAASPNLTSAPWHFNRTIGFVI